MGSEQGKRVLHDTGARIVIEQLNETHAQVSVDKTTFSISLTDLRRLYLAAADAIKAIEVRDVRD